MQIPLFLGILFIMDLYYLAARGEVVGVLEVGTSSPLLTHSFSTLASSFALLLLSLSSTFDLLLTLASSSLLLFSLL